jgi:hypothetical protein
VNIFFISGFLSNDFKVFYRAILKFFEATFYILRNASDDKFLIFLMFCCFTHAPLSLPSSPNFELIDINVALEHVLKLFFELLERVGYIKIFYLISRSGLGTESR